MRKDSIRCRHCHCGHCPVSHTWKRVVSFRGQEKTVIRRRRTCRNCGLSFTTVETYEAEEKTGYPEEVNLAPKNPYIGKDLKTESAL